MIIVTLLGPARKDPEILCLVAQICARLDESEELRGQGKANSQTSKRVKHPDIETCERQ